MIPGKNFREREAVKRRCTNTIRKILALHPKERNYIISELNKSIAKNSDGKLNDKVTVLFAREDSIYKTMVADVYDINRDARNFTGSNPIIAHPPCRAWGILSHFAKPRPDEKELAIFAVNKIREVGGVLEHPVASRLWPTCKLPAANEVDEFGGFTLIVNQSWWGHPAEKKTRLYIVGIDKKNLPFIPKSGHKAKFVITTSKPGKPQLSKKLREHTPYLFAQWLIQVAERCKAPALICSS